MTTIFLILTIIVTSSWPASPLSFNYGAFNDSTVKLEGDASIQSNSVQITTTSAYASRNFSVGRVTNLERMHLWDNSSRRLTDFTTEFTFQIYAADEYAEQNDYGDGMTFFLADPNLEFNKSLTAGAGLGIAPVPDPNQKLNLSKYQFLAVEFDTYQNQGLDPSYPLDVTGNKHVGIDINSIISNITEPWNMSISDKNKNCHARIDYNSSTHNLSVTFSGSMTQEGLQYLWYQVDLRDFLPEWVIVGFSASTGASFEMHNLSSWSLSSLQIDESAPNPTPTVAASPQPPPKKGSKIRLWLGLGIGLCFFFCFIGCFWFLRWKKKASQEEEFVFDSNLDEEFEKGTGPKRFSYNELVSATNNFADAEKLGQGGFGGVYKVFLKDLNSFAAIKRVSRGSEQWPKEHVEKQYASEVKVISQLRHKNLVKLIGWCHQKSDLLLIYEFMPNRSLDFHLFEEHSILTWQVRYNIAQGLASALLYLQTEWEQCVLHRDIKSSNIMLDSKFTAKLGDFGLARLVDHEKGSQITDAAGTMGYMAPEYRDTGKASKESDVFSFGVVALEIACGRKPVDLVAKEGQVRMVEWVWKLYGKGKILEAVDPKLRGEFDIQQVEHLMVVGLWCAHPDYMQRPSIIQALNVLNSKAPLPKLPEKMPVPTYLHPPSIAIEIENTSGNAFEIENNGTQSSKNSGYTISSQFTSSSGGSASAAHQHTH